MTAAATADCKRRLNWESLMANARILRYCPSRPYTSEAFAIRQSGPTEALGIEGIRRGSCLWLSVFNVRRTEHQGAFRHTDMDAAIGGGRPKVAIKRRDQRSLKSGKKGSRAAAFMPTH